MIFSRRKSWDKFGNNLSDPCNKFNNSFIRSLTKFKSIFYCFTNTRSIYIIVIGLKFCDDRFVVESTQCKIKTKYWPIRSVSLWEIGILVDRKNRENISSCWVAAATLLIPCWNSTSNTVSVVRITKSQPLICRL